jgi:membrane protein DedA with SNARE-associated domain
LRYPIRGSAILDHIIATLAQPITQAIAWLGYPGIALMMMLESLLVPIPSEIATPFADYFASTGCFHLIWAALAGTPGCNTRSTIIYYVGAKGGRPFAEKYGRFFFTAKKIKDYFHRWGGVTLLITRMMPPLPVIVSLPAGFARMPMWKFQVPRSGVVGV